MLFEIVDKTEFERLLGQVLETNEVIAPKRVATDAAGRPVHHFLPVKDFSEIDLDYETTEFSAKPYFLPFCETLSTYRFDGGDWTQEIRYWDKPRMILGLHACDINALTKLDKVFTKEFFPSPYYLARRRNTMIVGIDHDPCEGGFCHSLGTDTVTIGFDLFLTDLGDRYFVAIGTDRGYSLLHRVESRSVAPEDREAYLQVRKRISEGFGKHIDVQNLPKILDLQFESEVWKEWGDRCLSCGSCAMVCPTCYCYEVNEFVSMDFNVGEKVRRLYSCNLPDFAVVAGGHNFRPNREQRLKYRYYHQHRGFVEAYGEPKCVGCNRCGRTCLAGISPVDVIESLQAEDRP